MGKLGKILAPIVAILTIAAVVFSCLLYDGLNKYQNRSAQLASGLVVTAEKLSIDSEDSTSSAVKFTPAQPGVKESGSLAFLEYKKDPAAYEKTVKKVETLAAKINTQKNEMADIISELTISLGAPSANLEAAALKNADKESYSPRITLAKDYAAAFRKRDNLFIQYIKAYAQAVGTTANGIEKMPAVRLDEETNTFTVTANNTEPKLSAIEREIRATVSAKNNYQASLKAIRGAISNYKSWKSNPASLNDDNAIDVLAALRKDLNGINGELSKLATTQANLKKAEGDKKRLESEKNAIISQLNAIKAKLAKAEKLMKENGITADGKPYVPPRVIIKSFGEIDKTIRGNVAVVNTEWNYLITDLGNEKVMEGTPLIVVDSKNQYLASAKITKVKDNVSLAEIVRGNATDIKVNEAKIIIGNLDD